MDIKGVSAIVTGGASGIGAAVARMLAARGAKVVVADLQEEKGNALAKEIGGAYCKVDVTNTQDIINAYITLHELGWAHSFETFDENGVLIGGLYGVRVNGLFAGESMFHLKQDASKVALMHLVATMQNSAMSLLDVQWLTPHLETLGATEIPRDDYLRRLDEAVNP